MLNGTNHLRYKDKVVIVTGGTSGIGEGIAKVFVREGAKVVVCSNEEEKGLLLKNSMESKGPGLLTFLYCNLKNENEIKKLINDTVNMHGGLDCLINNAGDHPPHHTIDEFSSQQFRDLFELNVMAYFLTSKYALPHLRKRSGNIINNSSLVASIGQVGAVTYCATKGAVSAMTRALAIDEAAHSVRVNAFSPGNIMTPMWRKAAMEDDEPNKMFKAGKDAQLMGRFGTPEECGELCLFLAAEATFMTGVDVPLSAGAELSYGFKNRTCLNINGDSFESH